MDPGSTFTSFSGKTRSEKSGLLLNESLFPVNASYSCVERQLHAASSNLTVSSFFFSSALPVTSAPSFSSPTSSVCGSKASGHSLNDEQRLRGTTKGKETRPEKKFRRANGRSEDREPRGEVRERGRNEERECPDGPRRRARTPPAEPDHAPDTLRTPREAQRRRTLSHRPPGTLRAQTADPRARPPKER
ncbi:hypothetical protein WMY93_034029 [Mugilogobius chulae]|uniref:Uncharacterized protein n=1 Tax=Mugilogobius chulae TaxID=88201 RepID=A0AAW0MIF1_9GOBI